MRAEALKGHLDALLLATLADGPRHGYAIKEALRLGSGGRFDLPTGTVYPALHRLERKGLLSEEWRVSETGRQAKYYTLTPKGRTHLRAERKRWEEYSGAVAQALAIV